MATACGPFWRRAIRCAALLGALTALFMRFGPRLLCRTSAAASGGHHHGARRGAPRHGGGREAAEPLQRLAAGRALRRTRRAPSAAGLSGSVPPGATLAQVPHPAARQPPSGALGAGAGGERVARNALPAGVATAAGAASFSAALRTSLNAMGEVAVSLIIGALAYRRGILTPQALSSVSALTVGIFIPALLCGKVARTAAEMQIWGIQSWLLLAPVCALVQIGLQLLISGGVLKCIAGVDPSSAKGRIMRLATMFPNSAMPLLFCQSLFRGRDDIMLLAEGAISFYLIGWSTTFWTAGFSLLKGAPAEAGSAAAPSSPEPEKGARAGSGGARGALGLVVARLRQILTPPVCGVITGLVFGLVPLLRWLVVPHAGRAAAPPLAFAFYGLENLGRAAIPASQVVLSGSLARSLDTAWSSKAAGAEGAGDEEYRWRWRDLLAVCVSRVVFSPIAAGLGLCWLLQRAGLISLAPGVGQVLAFVLILESAMPSAQNAIVIPNLLGRPRMASAMAQLLLSVYVIALPCASLWLALGLHWTGV